MSAGGPRKDILMNDDTRLRDGHGPRARRPAGLAAARRWRNRRLRGARPWHQQLPAADRLSDRRRISRGRFLLAHHPARRGHFRDRLDQRCRDRARHRGACAICSDKIRYRKARAPAADRDRSLPRGRQCRRVSATGWRPRPASELEVIDRETEATLAVIGCSPLLDPKGRGAILFDIGGGSTELVRIERDPDRPRRGAADQGVDVDPARRRHDRRAFWRPRRHAGNPMRGWSRRSRNMSRRSRPSTARDLRDMHLLGTSGTVTTLAGVHLNLRALRPPPHRRHLDERCRSHRDHRAAARHELPGARRQQLHQRRARRSGAGRLRHSRCDPQRLPAAAAARRRPRPARGHAGRDDARGRRAERCR